MDEQPIETRKADPSVSEPTRRGFPQNLFLKAEGIRAGWRLLLYLGIFFALLVTFSFFLGFVQRPSSDVFSPSLQFFSELGSFLAAYVAAWIMSAIERRPVGAYGLPRRGTFGKLFWQGSLFGLCEITVLIGCIAVFGKYSFGDLAEHGSSIVWWALFWAVLFLAVALFEEFFFRGYTLFTLAEGIRFWPAALVLALCFGAVHRTNPGENWIGEASVFLVGLFWSFTLRRTGSLWFSLGMHAAFDFGETFLFSVPDSGMVLPGHLSNATLHGPNWVTGGTPGPEASLFDFLIIAVFFVVFHFLYPAKQTSDAAAMEPGRN